MGRREITCVNCVNGNAVVLDALRDAGWHVNTIDSLQDGNAVVFDPSASFGLLAFADDNDAEDEFLSAERLLADNRHATWLALLSPEYARLRKPRQLIVDYCYGYLTLPLRQEGFASVIEHVYDLALMRSAESAESAGAEAAVGELFGRSPCMQNTWCKLLKFARSDATATISGESGTGKELAARALHRHSQRHAGPFVAVNCAAIPPNLIQSELFGHYKGAFTGAVGDKMGRVEAAQGGTLFLDEIGDLSLDLQANLLRFLQEGVIERIGGHKVTHIDTRVVAATHRNLEDDVKAGTFREDLYYRLSVLRLHLPPLRDRGNDIQLLADVYLEKFARMYRRRVIGFRERARVKMAQHDWPGHVRELVNRIEQAVVISESQLLSAADLELDDVTAQLPLKTLKQARHDADFQALQLGLQHAHYNISEAAKLLGVSRLTVYRQMENFGIETASINNNSNKTGTTCRS